MNKDSKIYVTKEGYEQYIEAYKTSLANLQKARGKRPMYGFNSVDDPTTGVFDSEVDRLKGYVDEYARTIERLVIVENEDSKDGVIGIGDIVTVFSLDLNEIKKYKLSGGMPSLNYNEEIFTVTINAPMGKALYKSKVGDTVSYSVGNNKFTINIISKENGKEQEKQESQPE